MSEIENVTIHPGIPVNPQPISELASAELRTFIADMPKVELHVHLEGTLEPEMKFALARRNGVSLPYGNVAALRDSYVFHDLQSFLAVFYEGNTVLLKEVDFYDLCYGYLARVAAQNVVHVEMFFDPQQHLSRGIAMADIIGGIARAQADASRQFSISSGLILCFIRELSAESAMDVLEAALPFRDHLVGVGLDSDERCNPPVKFAQVFARARQFGLRVTVHCDIDQEDTLDNIRQVIEDVEVDRIDHGGNILLSAELMRLARERRLAFTICPTFGGMLLGRAGGAPVDIVRGMLDGDLCVTVNTDDPAYMGSEYLTDALIRAYARSALNQEELVRLQHNAIRAAWVPEQSRIAMLDRLEAFATERRLQG